MQIVRMRDDGDLGQGDHNGKKQLNSGYISKVDITRFSEKLDKVKQERVQRRFQDFCPEQLKE